MAQQKMVVDVPEGSLFYGNGYVYFNIESTYDPNVKYTRSKRLCIGKNIDKNTMYANKNYIALFAKDSLPESPERSDSLAIGVPLLLKKTACDIGLDSSLLAVFEQDETIIYKLNVEFPKEYNLAQYEGIVEYVKITIKSAQRVV